MLTATGIGLSLPSIGWEQAMSPGSRRILVLLAGAKLRRSEWDELLHG